MEIHTWRQAKRLDVTRSQSDSPFGLLLPSRKHAELAKDEQMAKFPVPPERARQLESQPERRVIFPVLDRYDCLPRDSHYFGKLRLSPIRFGAQHAQPVLHR